MEGLTGERIFGERPVGSDGLSFGEFDRGVEPWKHVLSDWKCPCQELCLPYGFLVVVVANGREHSPAGGVSAAAISPFVIDDQEGGKEDKFTSTDN